MTSHFSFEILGPLYRLQTCKKF